MVAIIEMKQDKSLNESLIGVMIRINNKHWRVSDKTFRYGREWQYTLSREMIDGSYESMRVSEDFLDEILKENGKVQISLKQNKMGLSGSKWRGKRNEIKR